jgi:hypothetical protein
MTAAWIQTSVGTPGKRWVEALRSLASRGRPWPPLSRLML